MFFCLFLYMPLFFVTLFFEMFGLLIYFMIIALNIFICITNIISYVFSHIPLGIYEADVRHQANGRH